MPSRLDDVLKSLRAEGFRVTGPRKGLIKFILAKRGHWTIQDLANAVIEELPGIGVATVYRTVSLLQRQKLITETRLTGGAARYEVAPKHHHDHLTCMNCGKIFEFENDEIEALQFQAAKKLGFDLLDHRMELYGECRRPNCPNRRTESPPPA